ncbi:hypothetical protein GC722_04945 [Auraticoccus sp. F435]|uniref:Uncharacterized protein n=1 Tax=Auraticoccus cholistanensis TaxID=2656650 RepID=A0A6A9V0D0_9ACTN|nr:hypothetical protein [Auraticoccus cholistanensis]MVA75379.1 hypothetical protein [Auraticoccus cholistanensis]
MTTAPTAPRPGDVAVRRRRLLAAAAGTLLLLAALLVALLPAHPTLLPVPERLVLVGVAGATVGGGEGALLDTVPAAAGTLSTDTAASRGGCAADGWLTLSAGTPVDAGGRCAVAVTGTGGVRDWRDLETAAAVHGGTLGALAEAGACLTAVGPAAALGAARGDGTVAEYLPVDDFVSGGYATACPVVLVDGDQLFGSDREAAVAALAAEPGTRVVVAGLGPGALRRDSDPRPVWVVGEGVVEGELVAADGAPAGIADLAAELRRVATGAGPAGLGVRPGPVDAASAGRLVEDRTALAHRGDVLAGLVVVALLAAAAVVVGRGTRWRRRLAPWLAPVLAAVPAGLQLTALTRWWRLPSEAVAVAGVLAGTLLVAACARWAAPRLAAAAWTLAATASAGTVVVTTLLPREAVGGLLGPRPGAAPGGGWLLPALALALLLAGSLAGWLRTRRAGRR